MLLRTYHNASVNKIVYAATKFAVQLFVKFTQTLMDLFLVSRITKHVV